MRASEGKNKAVKGKPGGDEKMEKKKRKRKKEKMCKLYTYFVP